jgi:hypothetical protein
MKNALNVLALLLVAAAPTAFIIELAGTTLPTIVNAAHLGGAFMLTLLFKIISADYVRSGILAAVPTPAAKSPLRLAA